jgi:hypothetical protein
MAAKSQPAARRAPSWFVAAPGSRTTDHSFQGSQRACSPQQLFSAGGDAGFKHTQTLRPDFADAPLPAMSMQYMKTKAKRLVAACACPARRTLPFLLDSSVNPGVAVEGMLGRARNKPSFPRPLSTLAYPRRNRTYSNLAHFFRPDALRNPRCAECGASTL